MEWFKTNQEKLKKKNMSWTQAKSNYPKLSPFKDADKDGVKNWLDCKPFDKKRQDEELDFAKAHDWGKEAEREGDKIINIKDTGTQNGEPYSKTVSVKANIKSLRDFGGY